MQVACRLPGSGHVTPLLICTHVNNTHTFAWKWRVEIGDGRSAQGEESGSRWQHVLQQRRGVWMTLEGASWWSAVTAKTRQGMIESGNGVSRNLWTDCGFASPKVATYSSSLTLILSSLTAFWLLRLTHASAFPLCASASASTHVIGATRSWPPRHFPNDSRPRSEHCKRAPPRTPSTPAAVGFTASR